MSLVYVPYLTRSLQGSLLSILHYHFDTTTGPKLEAQSYRAMYAIVLLETVIVSPCKTVPQH